MSTMADQRRLGTKCPHQLVQYCPLYVAGHVVGLPTCLDKWDYDGCDVDHGRGQYEELIARLFRRDPSLIAERALAEARAEATAQRNRNIQRNAIH